MDSKAARDGVVQVNWRSESADDELNRSGRRESEGKSKRRTERGEREGGGGIALQSVGHSHFDDIRQKWH